MMPMSYRVLGAGDYPYDAQSVRHRLVVAVDYGTTYSGDYTSGVFQSWTRLLTHMA
jgi:hypothetical protein